MAGGHRACAARSVLDGSERGARLEQDGPHREDAEGAGLNDTTLMQQALGLPPPWTVVGAHFDADYRRRMKSAGCVSPTRTRLVVSVREFWFGVPPFQSIIVLDQAGWVAMRSKVSPPTGG